MKNISKLGVLIITASAALSGCALNSNHYDPEKVNTEVKLVFGEFQTTASDFTQGAMNSRGFEQLFLDIEESLSEEDLTKFKRGYASTSDKYDDLSPEGQKIAADLYRDFVSPISDFYDWSNMSDSERATIGAMNVIITSATDEKDAKSSRQLDDKAITIEDSKHVRVKYEDPDQNATNTSREVFLIKTNKGWLIDGARTYDDYVKPESKS